MKISVIIPIYNVEKYLDRCIKSVLAQTFLDFELILIDDGSPDNCGKICDSYARLDKRIKVIHQKNAGLSAARNAGLSIATGEYYCFVDSDDYIHPNQLEFLLKLCVDNNVKMSVSGFAEVTPQSTNDAKPLQNLKTEIIDAFSYIERLCTGLQVLYVVPWGKLYHKSLFDNVKYPIATLSEDDCVIHTLALNAQKIAVCYEILYFYCINPQSISRVGIPIDSIIKTLKFKEDRMQILKSNNQFKILYTVQRLLFYDLLLERSKLDKADKQNRKYLKNYVRNIFCKILQNPAKSKTEAAKMLLFLINDNKIKSYTHQNFLR